jgi:hypothetical protein
MKNPADDRASLGGASRGADPAATYTGLGEEDVELPVDHVRIRREAPSTPVKASHRSAGGQESYQEVLPRRFAEKLARRSCSRSLAACLIMALLAQGFEELP